MTKRRRTLRERAAIASYRLNGLALDESGMAYGERACIEIGYFHGYKAGYRAANRQRKKS